MKNYNDLFDRAERLKPTEDLWQNIEKQVQGNKKFAIDFERDENSNGPSSRFSLPWLKMAAGFILAIGLLTTGIKMRREHSTLKNNTISQENDNALTSELANWHADLGEWDANNEDNNEEYL